MDILTLVYILCILTVGLINGAAINELPGFENFTECKTDNCWHEVKHALHTLFKKGYEPFGIKKIDPLKLGTLEDEFFGAKFVFRDVELSGFDTNDDIKYIVDKENKLIYQDAKYDLTFQCFLEQIFNFDKEYKFDTHIEAHYPNVLVTLTRHFDLEKRLFEGREESFMVPKGYALAFKHDGAPEVTYSSGYSEKINNNEQVKKWLQDHQQEVYKTAQVDFGKHVKTFPDAIISVLEKIDEHYPVSRLMPQFRTSENLNATV